MIIKKSNKKVEKNEKKREKNGKKRFGVFGQTPKKREKNEKTLFSQKNVFKTGKKRNGLFELGKKTGKKRNGTPRPKEKNETKKRFRVGAGYDELKMTVARGPKVPPIRFLWGRNKDAYTTMGGRTA